MRVMRVMRVKRGGKSLDVGKSKSKRESFTTERSEGMRE